MHGVVNLMIWSRTRTHHTQFAKSFDNNSVTDIVYENAYSVKSSGQGNSLIVEKWIEILEGQFLALWYKGTVNRFHIVL